MFPEKHYGALMKKLIIFLIAIGLVLPFFSADAQSKHQKTNIDTSQQFGYQTDNVANNIDDEANMVGKEIDKVGFHIDNEANRIGKEIDKVGNNIDNIVNHMVNRGLRFSIMSELLKTILLNQHLIHSPDITDSEIDTSSQSFSGNKVIEESETIDNNVVVKGGDLTVYGTVNGDVLVVGGDLHMKRTGKITGNARVVNGSILKEDGAVIKGFEDYSRKEKLSFRPSRRKFFTNRTYI